MKKFPKCEKKRESCVLCGKDTPYSFDTPLEKRVGYVDGCGQLCKKCFSVIQAELNEITSE